MTVRIINADCREALRSLPDQSVHCCVTSPPYFGLRDYGHAGQIGLEPTPDEFVAAIVEIFREVRRVLRDDGTLWLNLGDSYCSTDKWGGGGNADKQRGHSQRHAGFNDRWDAMEKAGQQAKPAMMRDVWFVPPGGFDEAHFAVMPEELARRCVLAGCPEGGTVLDPFGGAGTTGLVADRLGRNAVLIELNPEYATMAKARIAGDGGLFANVEAA